jgi:hypothetical protein
MGADEGKGISSMLRLPKIMIFLFRHSTFHSLFVQCNRDIPRIWPHFWQFIYAIPPSSVIPPRHEPFAPLLYWSATIS